MLGKSIAILLFLGLLTVGSHANDDWWKYMQLYQIYPRSFMDSNGDGIGDLQGIKSKLQHLSDIGVDAAWISPMFVSPMKDFGYDIEDFYKIAEEYGTLRDFHELIEEAKRLGIKILLDFVPNHTSDLCEWFKLSANRTEGWENFYVWHPGKIDENGNRIEPSNWRSVFRGSAWTWHEGRGEYYLHQFLPQQPDLNFRDPHVENEMKNVLRYWLDQGAEGFRVDAIPHLVEVDVDEDGNYPDEPVSGNTDDEEEYSYLNHIHTRERDETFNQVYMWRETLDDFAIETGTESKVLLMEAMSDIDIIMKYYGNSTHEGAHLPFNFELMWLDRDSDANEIKRRMDRYFSKVPEGRVSNWVLGNHDKGRLATRFGTERSDGLIMMSFFFPGVSVTYYGEEISMLNFYMSWEDTQDPSGCNAGPDRYNQTSRDPARTPMQWDTTKNSGFSTADKTWLPVADNYFSLNVESQKEAEKSPYKFYQSMSALRRSSIVRYGTFRLETFNEDVIAFTRTEEDEILVFVVNVSENPKTEDLSVRFEGLSDDLEIILANVDSSKSEGDLVQSKSLSLEPYEALAMKNYLPDERRNKKLL